MQSTIQVQTNGSLQSAHLWASFSRVSMLKRWAAELKSAVSNGADATVWRLTGKAAMIVHNDHKTCLELAKRIAFDANFNFIELDSNQIMELVGNSDYLQQKTPALVFVPQGEWSNRVDPKSDDDLTPVIQFQKKFSSYLEKIDPAHPLIFLTSCNAYQDISEELRQAGSFDRRFVISKPTLEEQGLAFLQQVGLEMCDSSLTAHPGKVGKLLDIHFDDDRRQGLIALAMQRIANKEKRLLTFKDLVGLGMQGSGETEALPETMSRANLERNAIHEAGHALVSMLDSGGTNIPEYSTIIQGEDYSGVVVESYGYHYSHDEQTSYAQMRHQIRISLAGRAAEELVLGIENVSAWGARSDLIKATGRAKQLMGLCGFSPSYEKHRSSRENLAVVEDAASISEDAHIENSARLFLAQQYDSVVNLIDSNRALLETITERLLKNKVLDQEDFLEILNSKMSTPLNPLIGALS